MNVRMWKEGVILRIEKRLPQEGLKLIACLSMLLDHIGASILPLMGLRVIGRLAFPIYCFLLAEGMAHTRSMKKYALRLAVMAVVSELPFDLLLFGGINLRHQNVMVTLLLGCLMVLWMGKIPRNPLIPVIFCALAAEVLGTDYGAMGVAMIALFVLTRQREDGWLLRILGVAVLCWMIGGAGWQIGYFYVPAQMFGVAALVPIGLYSGRKVTNSKLIQWGFYLFYPVHLLALWLIKVF